MFQTEILVTGGTLDKDYNPHSGLNDFSHIRSIEDSAVSKIIASNKFSQCTPRLLFVIDSLDMTDEQRHVIITECLQSEAEHIVVTHGTDTMVETAVMAQRVISDKTVVFTGAMRPFCLGRSDASANLCYALGVAQLLPSGVYIAMNGQTFDPRHVEKNKQELIFQRK